MNKPNEGYRQLFLQADSMLYTDYLDRCLTSYISDMRREGLSTDVSFRELLIAALNTKRSRELESDYLDTFSQT